VNADLQATVVDQTVPAKGSLRVVKSFYMRDSTKVIIGFGSIWGLFAFAGMLFSSLTIGANDSAPEVLTILLYGLTILPSRILAIWFMRYAALSLMLLATITAFGLVYQVMLKWKTGRISPGKCFASRQST
jgi:hypothetical protein